ncbi:hypothetical protein DMA11_18260 [Marinilabiliaceae bacterium JC017]|nr:hypothetical protein DMA11_18260 [Marinilabiliaceae bacterium JC017]
MQRFGLLIMLVLGFSSVITAQEKQDKDIQQTVDLGGFKLPASVAAYDSLPKHDFGFEVGTSVFTNFDGGYGFNTYVAPRLTLKPTKKLQFDTYGYLGRSSFYDMPVWIYPGVGVNMNQTAINLGVYGQGTYFVNEKVYVGGSAFVENMMPQKHVLSPALKNLTNYGGSAYVGYKFSEHFKVEAEFGVSKYGTYPAGYYQGGFYNGGNRRSNDLFWYDMPR